MKRPLNLKDNALYLCEQIRTCEQQLIQQGHRDELSLMMEAGKEVVSFIKQRYPELKHIAVFCGKGNNAGDGYAFARFAHEQSLSVVVYQCFGFDDLSPAAKHMAKKAIDAQVNFQSIDEFIDTETELIVDALLGIGTTGPVYGPIANAINQINSSGLPVVSLDCPSGLNADTGKVENLCVLAHLTLTFIAPKPGMFTSDGPDHCAEIISCSLQMEYQLANLSPYALLLADNILAKLPRRKKNSHKGQYGHVLVIGGGPGMPGAASLCAKAALRAGSGMVTVATYPTQVNAILPIIPEAMVYGVQTAKELESLLARATVCVLGPGLGDSQWAKALFLTAIRSQLPMIIDASALHLLASYPQTGDNWVLTPHPGEAAFLLACSINDIQFNRFESTKAIQTQYGGVIVLKGAGTIIQGIDKKLFVCPRGNPGMATAGMGDALSGIIAALCAQGLPLSESAKLGVWIHASAGDKAVLLGEVGLLTTDLIDLIPVVLNGR